MPSAHTVTESPLVFRVPAKSGEKSVPRRKRMTLVFPPMTMPTSPPLGVAMLKGYIERELADWQVTVLDLNVWLFRLLLDGLSQGQIQLTDDFVQRMGADIPTLLRAAKAFSGGDDHAFYEQAETYDRYGVTFLSFTEIFTTMLGAEATEFERSGTLSDTLGLLVQQIEQTQPQVVGVSMIFSQQLPIGAMLGHYLRKKLGIKVFFGGSCFTEGVEHFMKWYPEAADVIVTGDGELPLKSLLQSAGEPQDVPGTYYRRNDALIHHAAAFQKDIDAFGAPDFSHVNFASYYSPEPVAALLLSRGCYWRKCTFCVHYFSAGDTYRLHSLDNVIAMLRRMVEQGVRHFSFVDEMIAPGHFIRLARAIREAKLDIAYYALSKPNKTFTPEILQEMAASGCKYILWGLESGNQRVLDLMGKGTKVDEVAQVLHDARAAGIHNHVYVICGFPTETQEEFEDTLRFLDSHQASISAIHRGTFSLEPGSPISKDLPKFSIDQVWVRQDTPLGARLGYRCTSGMSMEEAAATFKTALPFLKRFNPYAQFLANFRDHALLVYDKRDPTLRFQDRHIPALQLRQASIYKPTDTSAMLSMPVSMPAASV